MRPCSVSILALLGVLACGGPPSSGASAVSSGAGGATTSSSTTGTGGACAVYGTAKAGEPCASDCDCCGHACTTEHVCAATCLDAGP